MAKKEMTFEQSMARLEEIVSQLENNEKPLEETIALFEEGLNLVKSCQTQLSSFEKKVEELSGKTSGEEQ